MDVSLSRHICAYIDVLGGAELFQCLDQEAIEGFVDVVLDLERRLNNLRRDGTPVVKTFTDNVFAAYPLKDSGKYSIEHQVGYFLSEITIQLQQIFLFCELPVRGAIVVGDLYIDDRIVVGAPVVKAVGLEKNSKPPRVVLDESVLALLPNEAREYFAYTAPDGCCSLNYLGLNPAYIKTHRQFVERGLSQYADEPSILTKYHWLLEYQECIEALVQPKT